MGKKEEKESFKRLMKRKVKETRGDGVSLVEGLHGSRIRRGKSPRGGVNKVKS